MSLFFWCPIAFLCCQISHIYKLLIWAFLWEEWKIFFVFLCFHAHITTYYSNFLFLNPYMIYFLCIFLDKPGDFEFFAILQDLISLRSLQHGYSNLKLCLSQNFREDKLVVVQNENWGVVFHCTCIELFVHKQMAVIEIFL